MSDLTIKQGRTFWSTLVVTDEAGDIADLTGATVVFHVRLLGGAADVLTEPLSITDAEAGIADLRLTPAQTDDLEADHSHFYNVELIDAAGDSWTPIEGRLFVRSVFGF